LLAGVNVVETRALGTLQHPSIEESVVGVRGILSNVHRLDGRGASPRRVWFEASENRLYGIAGLHASGLRIGAQFGSVSLTAAAAHLASDIGRETRLALTPAHYAGDRWAASVGVVHESASVDGFTSAELLSLTVRSRVRLSETVSVGGEIDRYRLSGEPNHGADATLVAAIRPVSAALIHAVFAFDRRTGLHPSIAMTFDGVSAFRLTLGYEGMTDALKGALAVEVGGFVCAVGVDYHPVLGSRRGITLAWHR
jgi:hypothetical protein